jgi:hypothetical protein
MSTLKVGAIRGTSASADAITVHASDGTATGKLSNVPVENLVQNGAFNLAQRGTSSTSANYATVDRFAVKVGGADEAPTQAQVALTSSDAGPWEKGFRNCYQITNGNQTSGAGAADYLYVMHRIEAQNIGQSGWNYTSTSSYLTLSFWVKSSVAQTMYVRILSVDGTWQNYPHPFSATTSWSKISFSIPGNSNIQIDNNNAEGLELRFDMFLGTDYTDNSVADNTWAAGGSSHTKDQTSTWWTTNDSTYAITGVQLTVTDYVPEYPFLPYGDELARCQRYYEGVYMSDGTALMKSYLSHGGSANFEYQFKVQKRAIPTWSLEGNAAWTGATPNAYESQGSAVFQDNGGTLFVLGDASGDLCGSFSAEL